VGLVLPLDHDIPTENEVLSLPGGSAIGKNGNWVNVFLINWFSAFFIKSS
jgi:hypothetical protein